MPAKSLELRHAIISIQMIEEEISEIESEINKLMSNLDSSITTIPGIGIQMGAVILAEIGDFTQFDSPDKILAFAWKDNRAFCKYICPITVFLKPMSYFALFRVTCDKEKCISCGKCKYVCPMDVDVTDNSRNRENGTECILCMECVKACPKRAL